MLNEEQYRTPDNYNARIYLNKTFKTNPESKFKWIFKQFPDMEKMDILEIGCGTGLFWLANRDCIPEKWNITLTDYSEGMLQKTRSTLSKTVRNFIYNIVNAEILPYADRSFDLILANNMLYHVENRPAVIAGIYRALRNGGVFIASTMGRNDMKELNLIFNKFQKRIGNAPEPNEFRFSLENGMEQLNPVFQNVELKRYQDSLRITEVGPIVDYYLSFNNMDENSVILSPEDAVHFRKYLQEIMDREKEILVTKDSGMFICRK